MPPTLAPLSLLLHALRLLPSSTIADVCWDSQRREREPERTTFRRSRAEGEVLVLRDSDIILKWQDKDLTIDPFIAVCQSGNVM